MSYVYMKVLETAPYRFDRGVRLLTLGRLGRVHGRIAASLAPGTRVLDVGCGTGSLVILLARKGVEAMGVDISDSMLQIARRRIVRNGLEEWAEVRQMGIVDLDSAFPDASFDAVTCTLVLSELSEDEVSYGLEQCRRILGSQGRLYVADEVLPDSKIGQALTGLARFPFVLVTYLLTQTTSRRVGRLWPRIEAEGFRIISCEKYLAGTLQLLVAETID